MTSSDLTTVQPISTEQQAALDNAMDEMVQWGSKTLNPYYNADLISLFEETAKKQGYELSYYTCGGIKYRGFSQDEERVYSIKNLEQFADKESVEWYTKQLTMEQPITIYIQKKDRANNAKPWSNATRYAIAKQFAELGYILDRDISYDKKSVEREDYPGTQTFKAYTWTYKARKMNEREQSLWDRWHQLS